MKNYYIAAGVAVLILGIMKKDQIQKIFIDSITRYDWMFQKYGAQYGVDWKLLKRIAWIESNLGANYRVARGIANPSDIEGSKSSDGKSWGLMQLRPSTARDFDPSATAEKLNNPEYSIKLAAQYIVWSANFIEKFISRSNSRWEEFLIKTYNQGVGTSKYELTVKEVVNGADDYWKKYSAVSA